MPRPLCKNSGGKLKACRRYKMLSLCKYKMSLDDKIDEVNEAKNPAPAYNKEEEEYYDVQNALGAEHDAQAYKALNNPAYNGDNKQNYFNQSVLRIKPSVKIHNISLFKPPVWQAKSALRRLKLLKEQFFEQEHPNEVEPAENDT